jgi:hypothetical protein
MFIGFIGRGLPKQLSKQISPAVFYRCQARILLVPQLGPAEQESNMGRSWRLRRCVDIAVDLLTVRSFVEELLVEPGRTAGRTTYQLSPTEPR